MSPPQLNTNDVHERIDELQGTRVILTGIVTDAQGVGSMGLYTFPK